MAGNEINAQAVDQLRAGDIKYHETLEVYDGSQWWGFTDSPNSFTGKVLVGRTASSFFPFTPERVTVEPNGSWAYSQALINEDAQVFFATQTDTGGVRLVAWAYGSLVPQVDVTHDLWGADYPFQEIVGLYWKNGSYYILGKRFDQVWNGYRWEDTSCPAWAIWDSTTGSWQYDYLADTAFLSGIKFVQQGDMDPSGPLYCARFYQGGLKAWTTAIGDPATVWASLLSEAQNANNTIESYGVDGSIAIAQSIEHNDCLLFYHKSDGWVWEWKYTAQTKGQIWESGTVPLVGGGVVQTVYGEYKILAASAHGVKTKATGAKLTNTMQILSVRALDDTHVRLFYYDGGQLKTLRIDTETGAIDQAGGAGLTTSVPDKNFYPLYIAQNAELWVSNNHHKVEFYKVDSTTGAVVWRWNDWAGVLGADPAGVRLIPTATATPTAAVWAGDKAITGIDLATVAGALAEADVTTYLAGLTIVDTGFAGDMGRGDPFPCLAKLADGSLLFPFMTWSDNGDTFIMDAHIARFSSGMIWQETSTQADIWQYDWDAGYPYPIDWHCSWVHYEIQNNIRVVDLGTLGSAPLWCDISPWLINANGIWSYYQQPDKMYIISQGLAFTEVAFSRSTYPNGAHIAMYGSGDGPYRFFGAGARGEIGFWMWEAGDTAPTEKVINTEWVSNYNNLVVACTPGGSFVAAFYEAAYKRITIFVNDATTGRTTLAKALKVTTSTDPINEYNNPIDTSDAFVSLYASGQRTWFDLEFEGHGSFRGIGGASIYEERDFIPYPFKREGIRLDIDSLEKQVKIFMPDTQNRDIRSMIEAGTDFRGKRCILRRFLADVDPMDAGSSVVLIDGYIQDWAMASDSGTITFTVAHSVVDARNPFPPRILSLNCGHKFKGDRCKYNGAATTCDHTKPTCQALNNEANFGGFEHVAARQRRILWR